ncbi:hypothetical protein TNCV_2380491 [Trichonephila clavipes]|nr:hypothetical protein TNCV_2380491 [Trichonephila clavipes]
MMEKELPADCRGRQITSSGGYRAYCNTQCRLQFLHKHIYQNTKSISRNLDNVDQVPQRIFALSTRRHKTAIVSQFSRELYAVFGTRVLQSTAVRRHHEKGLRSRRLIVLVQPTGAYENSRLA